MQNNLYPYINNSGMPIYQGQSQPYMMQPNQSNAYPYMMQQMPQMIQPNTNQIYPYMNMMQPYGLGHAGYIYNFNNLDDIHNMDILDDLDDFDDMDDLDDMDGTDAKGTTSNRPAAVISNNPAVPTISLFKELTGYPNYGNPSGNADILYTGNRGVWTFQIPPIITVLGNIQAQLVIRAVLDDHSNVPVNRYSARISINGTNVHAGRVPLEHGTPAGRQFTNWKPLTFNVPNLRRNNRIIIVNTSNTGEDDWIGFDWMEMRFRS